jgi:hypothetical protein
MFISAAVVIAVLSFAAYWIWIRQPDLGPPGSNPAVVAAPDPSGEGLRLPKKVGSLRFAVIGDMGRGDQTQIDTANQMVRWHTMFDYDFVLMLGDNIYDQSGSPESFYNRFEVPYKPLLDAGIKFYAAVGNHDPTNVYGYKPFNMDGNRYYTFEKNKVRFFAIDTVNLDRTEQAWIREQLAKTGADWKIAFYHHPLYTSGRYGLSASRLRRVLEPIFVQGGLDVGLSGHDHIYERIVPQHGVQYFTSGSGGALRKGDLRASPITAAGFDQDTEFMLVEISGDTFYFQTVSRIGDTVDSGQFDRVEHHKPSGK